MLPCAEAGLQDRNAAIAIVIAITASLDLLSTGISSFCQGAARRVAPSASRGNYTWLISLSGCHCLVHVFFSAVRVHLLLLQVSRGSDVGLRLSVRIGSWSRRGA